MVVDLMLQDLTKFDAMALAGSCDDGRTHQIVKQE